MIDVTLITCRRVPDTKLSDGTPGLLGIMRLEQNEAEVSEWVRT